MNINIIVAYNSSRYIGKNNDLIHTFKKDIEHFKQLTTGNYVIMGRRTFESIGKPLADRVNIVISSMNVGGDVITLKSLNEAYEYCESMNAKEVFVIGGESIYREAIKQAESNQRLKPTEIYATEIESKKKGDTKFPTINNKLWVKNKGDFHFCVDMKDKNMRCICITSYELKNEKEKN